MKVPRSVSRALAPLRGYWARLRAWRRISFTSAGLVFTLGAVAVGFAAVNTGNNLLYLLLGAMLGFVGLSGWLSEQSIRAVRVTRWTPRGVPVDREVRIQYRVDNHKRRLPSMALEVGEEGLPGRAFLARVPAGGSAEARSVNRFVRRGVYPLGSVTVATTFPFGLFLKERDLELPGELVIWPRADLPLRAPRPGGGRARRRGTVDAAATSGHRGEYRSLREYRPGDDPRDIHWRRSASRQTPVVREYDVDGTESFWICLDTGAPGNDRSEGLVEVAASLAALATRKGRRFGLVAGGRRVAPGTGPGHFEAVLDALARTDFDPADPPPAPPVDPARCVLVSLSGRGQGRFGDAYVGAAASRVSEPPPGTGPDTEPDTEPGVGAPPRPRRSA